MKIGINGFPRIGLYRELKFSTEKYFKGTIGIDELNRVAKNIKKENWLKIKASGIDFIPSNDFSFYDTTLDTAISFNIVPKRYKDLGLSELDTTFALARGYQGDKGDVKALAMKKWFNTNYHYMVPELEDDTKIELANSRIIDEYKEALDLGIKTRPTILGPFTLLELSRVCGGRSKESYKDDLVNAYSTLLNKLNEVNAEWVELDEPYLVFDLNDSDKKLFKDIYANLLKDQGNLKVLIKTYFGDIRDNYLDVVGLPFDGIGLDFLEGKETLDLIKKNGFPNDKILFAGILNGKNIWRNNYKKSIDLIGEIKNYTQNIVLEPSCSLLHVPLRVSSEVLLDNKYKKHLSFAYEKLSELGDLKVLCEGDYLNNKIYLDNVSLHNEKNVSDKEVWDRIKNIKSSDYVRLPKFSQRESIQHKGFNLPLFPTTTIGSFPQISDVKAYRKKFKNHEISEDEYNSFIEEKIKECIKLQEDIGLDVLVHGEFERNDMVEYFGENLEGYLFTEYAWVQSYGTRCVKPPLVWGDIKRKAPMTVKWSSYAQSLTKKLVKGMLTGPVTILNWSFPLPHGRSWCER